MTNVGEGSSPQDGKCKQLLQKSELHCTSHAIVLLPLSVPATHRDSSQQHAGQVGRVPVHRAVGTEGHKLVGKVRLKSIQSGVEVMDL